MNEKKCQQPASYKMNGRWFLFVPLMVLLGIIPLIVRLVKVDVPNKQVLYLTNSNMDLFSQAKSTFIFLISGIILLLAFLAYNKAYIKKGGTATIYYISLAISAVMTLLATFLSHYPHIAKWGIPTRAEGGVMLLVYMLLLLYAFNIFRETKDYRYIIAPLIFLIVIQSILGYYQYKGEDLLMTEWGKKIIIPDYYAEDRANLQPLYKDKNIYGTLFHYNYVGSFAAMMVPLFGVLTWFLRDYKWKILCAVGSLGSLFLLFGSTARSGLIGVGLSLGIALILLSRYFIRHWKWIALGGLSLSVILVGLNVATNGSIYSRIPNLVEDMKQFIQPDDQVEDYKASLPISNIAQTSDAVALTIKDHQLYIGEKDGRLRFADEEGKQVPYVFMDFGNENSNYFTEDSRFKDFRFTQEIIDGGLCSRIIYKDIQVATLTIGEGVRFADHFTKQPIAFEEPATFGFEGKEKLGSARGYIWSRSLPLLKDTLFIGTGPDTFGFYFPQNDVLGKWYAYGTPSIIVDKPHNLYLQIGIQQGGIALVAFFVLIATYVVESIKLYGLKKEYNQQQVVGLALTLGIVGYLGAGMFNDSVVSVAPIFWVLLGCGMATNYIVKQQQQQPLTDEIQ